MCRKSLVLIALLFSGLFPQDLHAQANVSPKKLVEFGWDYPKVSYLKANLKTMEEQPFDGVVFSLDFDIYNAFDTLQRPDSFFQYNDLAKLKWKKFTDNFLLVRGAGLSGAHWLDDNSWVKIVQNLKKISKALAVSKAKGIGFDPEYYFSDATLNPWIYKSGLYQNLSYQEVGRYVRKRGNQFIQALQAEKPDVKVLCFWLLGLIEMQRQSLPVAETGMALYPFFVEGMLEGKNKTSEIIDGNEFSYGYQNAVSFVEAGETRRKYGDTFIIASLKSKFQNISLAQAIFFDLIYAKAPEYEKGLNRQTKEQWLKDNLLSAFKTTDKYVWFYNERINWWSGKVDSGVAQIINIVKDTVNDQWNKKGSYINGYSNCFDLNQKASGYKGFYYSYSKTKNTLQVTLLNANVISLQLYNNSRLIHEYGSKPQKSFINLTKIYEKRGNLIIISKDSNGIVSVAYVN